MPSTPVSPGAVLDRALQIFRAHFAVLFPVALVLGLIEAIVSYALGDAGTDPSAAVASLVISLVAGTFLQGMVAGLVRDVEAGTEDRDAGQLLRDVSPVIDRLLIVSVLSAIGAGIGFVFLIVPGLILMTIWAVVSPVVVVERAGVGTAFARSRELVRGYGWQVLGVLLLVLLMVFAVALVGGIVTAGASDGVGRFAQVLLGALVAPLSALATAVLYFDLRRAKGEPAPPVLEGREPAA